MFTGDVTPPHPGASYGGKGTANPILECGYIAAPFYAGSATRTRNQGYTTDIHSGGGAVRIHAENRFRLDGKIYADGLGRYCVPGGSGGGVWLTCRKFHLGDNAYISVRGGRSIDYGDNGGGAGGRIAIGLNFSDGRLKRMYEKGTLPGISMTDLAEISPDSETTAGQRAYSTFQNDWTGKFRISGELGYLGDSADTPEEWLNGVGDKQYGYRGGSGTAVLVEAPPTGMVILFRKDR